MVHRIVYCREYIRVIFSMTYQAVSCCCVYRLHCTDIELRMGESENGSCVYLSLNINIKITFRTNNTIHDIHKTRKNKNSTYMLSGIYQLQFHTCHLSYVGQTDRRLEQRYKEPTRYIASNKPQSAYALHILHSQHE